MSTDPVTQSWLDTLAAERARGDKHLGRALDAEYRARKLLAQLQRLVAEFVVEPASGTPYVHLGSNATPTDYQHHLFMGAMALVKEAGERP